MRFFELDILNTLGINMRLYILLGSQENPLAKEKSMVKAD